MNSERSRWPVSLLAVAAVAVAAIWGAVIVTGPDAGDASVTDNPQPTLGEKASKPSGRPVTVRSDGSTLTLGHVLADQSWWAVTLEEVPAPGDFALHQLATSRIETQAGVEVAPIFTASRSAYEYAAYVKAAGMGRPEWVGNVHGYEEETALRIVLDGQPVKPGIWFGERAVVQRKSVLHSPKGGVLGRAVTTYAMTEEGLRVSAQLRWRTSLSVQRYYVGMLPGDEELDQGAIGDSTPIPLTAGTSDAAGGLHAPALGATLSSNDVEASVEVSAAAVDGWATSSEGDGLTYIDDREGNVLNKVYFSRVSPAGGPVQVAPGDVWSSSALYTARRR